MLRLRWRNFGYLDTEQRDINIRSHSTVHVERKESKERIEVETLSWSEGGKRETSLTPQAQNL